MTLTISVPFSWRFLSGLAVAQPRPGFDIASLDRSVDPCVDFYKFSCGGWMAANPLPADQARYGSFDALQDRNRTCCAGPAGGGVGQQARPQRDRAEDRRFLRRLHG